MKPSITNLFTLESSNKGVPLPIKLPNGKLSGCSVHILGFDSDVFRKARTERARQGPTILALPEDERPEAIRLADANLLAVAVTGWDFPDTFNRSAVVEAFLQAPHIFDQVNEAVGERERFFDEKSLLCSDTPSLSSV